MTRATQLAGMIGIGQPGLPVAIKPMRAGLRVIGHRRVDREAFVRAGFNAHDNGDNHDINRLATHARGEPRCRKGRDQPDRLALGTHANAYHGQCPLK